MRHLPLSLATVLIAALLSLVLAGSAGAVKGPVGSFGEQGTSGGKFENPEGPRGIAVNPSTGNIYVADPNNQRIQEFTSSGSFLRAWGWNVLSGTSPTITGQSNAKQMIAVAAEGGSFTLTFNSQTTAAINYNAPARESEGAGSVEAALKALSSIGAGNVEVSGGPGNAAGSTPYIVTFVGALKEAAQATISASSALLTGSTQTATVTSVNPGGTGFEICEVAANCQAGSFGGGAGQFNFPSGIAVDPVTGSVYVTESSGVRVDKFTENGAFVRTWGYNVVASGPDNGPAGVSAVQRVTIPGTVTGGNFNLTFDGQSTRATGTGNTSSTTKVITGVATSTGTFVVGETISGTNIPPGAVISNVNTGAGTITFTAASNSTGTGPVANLVAGIPFNATSSVLQNVLRALPSMAGNSVNVALSAGVYTVTFRASLAFTPVPPITADSTNLVGGSATVATTTTGVSDIEICNPSVDVCQATGGLQVGGNGGFGTGGLGGKVAVDSSTGNVLIADMNNSRVQMFTSGGSFVEAFGWGVDASSPEEKLQVCPSTDICLLAIPGSGLGRFASASPNALAIDNSHNVYAVDFSNQRVERFAPSGPAGAPTAYTASQLSLPAGSTPFGVAVDPATNNVLVGIRATGDTSAMRVAEFSPAGALLEVHAAASHIGEGQANNPGTGGSIATACSSAAIGTPCASSSSPNGNIYLAVPQTSLLKKIFILNVSPPPGCSISGATGVGSTTATFNGTVTPPPPGPEGGFDTTYHFEYSTDGFNWKNAPVPDADAGSANAAVPVSYPVTGLEPNRSYQVRLSCNDGNLVTSTATSFTTTAVVPAVEGEFTSKVTTTSAKLNGKVNPNNSPTTYRFEWGTTNHYGHQSPEFDPFIGNGGQPQAVGTILSGLEPNTTYHWRLVAINTVGTGNGPDQEFTTYAEGEGLNSAHLPDNRRVELVTPPDKRPVGKVEPFFNLQRAFQVASNGEAIGYPILNGLEDSSSGGETVYSANRTEQGWSSVEISGPSLISPVQEDSSAPSVVRYYNPENLSCAILESVNPLSDEVPAADEANGVTNLYRWNAATGDYTLLTKKIPLEPAAVATHYYDVAGVSSDCSRVFFRSHAYTFIAGASGAYEWDSGVLRDAALLPDHAVPIDHSGLSDAAVPGAGQEMNTVSPGGRFFFTATSDQGGDNTKTAVFVRKSPTETVDASQPTAGATLGASYEAASADGSHVLFLANYGIAATSSTGPSQDCSGRHEGTGSTEEGKFGTTACDLYDYNVGTGQLTDISADGNSVDPRGAVVQGVLDVSGDGSTVYFAALGQLVPGRGMTYSQNLAGVKHANVYRWRAGTLTYVGSLTSVDLGTANLAASEKGGALIHNPKNWAAQTTKNGAYFLFVSHANMTETNPAEVEEAYLYSASTGATECVSCPQGTAPPHAAGTGVIQSPDEVFGSYQPKSLSEDGRVVFTVEDALTPDAVEGQGAGATAITTKIFENNVYEWDRGNVALLATGQVLFMGLGGPNGRDAFLWTTEKLDPRDFDVTYDLYDLRSGGGFPAPAEPPAPCDPALDQCQGAVTPAPSAPGLATGGPTSGNPPPARKHHKKAHHKKKSSKQHHRRKANSNRGGAK